MVPGSAHCGHWHLQEENKPDLNKKRAAERSDNMEAVYKLFF